MGVNSLDGIQERYEGNCFEVQAHMHWKIDRVPIIHVSNSIERPMRPAQGCHRTMTLFSVTLSISIFISSVL